MMLYLGIDLHRKQMTVSLRNESGDVLLRRQVSTRWSKVEEFRQQLHERMAGFEPTERTGLRRRQSSIFRSPKPVRCR